MDLKEHLPWLGALLPIASTQTETKSNVVVIYVDDMGIGNMGCCGGKFVPTSNIDKLAQDGLLFNQYYSSAPVGSPFRCGLTAGLFPPEVEINTFLNDKAANKRCGQRNFPGDKLPSVARVFQNAGYSTGHVGKWHMGGRRDIHDTPPIKNYGSGEYIPTYESLDPEPAITATKWIWSDKNSMKRWRRTEYFVDESVELVKYHKDEPFSLSLWPDDMHTPWVPEFKQKERKSWGTQGAFAPVLAEMDKQLGYFIKALDELGPAENTVIIFTNDNGPAPGFKSVRFAYLGRTKNSLYEGGIRMPFVIRYPKKIRAGQINSESVLCAVDLYPTLCSVAGIETKKGYKGDGQNCVKVLLGKPEAKRKTNLMWNLGRNKRFGFSGNPYDKSPHLAMYNGKWKLLVNDDGGDAQLYDMEKDKFGKSNITSEHPDLVVKLSKKVYR